ncbi:response regulator [Paenibacillus contaminans]|uniref:DNA-binding response regulator n=1 Tax=Paenibacillus contaminans TaxID=450362 RepID=A0A329MVH4_9BACL|nr:response regulator [Paenibacillus contaminans]RAV23304.1 hypothetical protein DQG23_03680 [Paenibacillus contaminans]
MNKLFIVEDEDIIRKGLVNNVQWEAWGFQVCGEAVNGKKALEYIEKHDVDVVLTDVRMPVMDGLELSRHVKRLKPEIKIVILTGFSEFEYARQSLENGVFQYILKPVKRDKLAEVFLRLREVLEHARLTRDLIQQAEESRSLLQEKQLNHWIHGRSVLPRHAEEPGMEMPPMSEPPVPVAESYVCAVLDVDNLGSRDMGFINRFKQFGYAEMKKLAMDSFRQEGCKDSVLCGFDDYGRLVLLLLSPGSNDDRLPARITSILENCSSAWEGASFSAGIGGAVKEAVSVSASYEQASGALSYRFYSGPGSLHRHGDIPLLRTITPQEFQKVKQAEKKLSTYISLGEGDLGTICTEMVAEIIEQGAADYGSVRTVLSQTLYSVLGYMAEQGHDLDLQMNDERSISELTDLTHIIGYVKRRLNEIKTEIERSDRTAGRNLVLRAKKYVAEHYRNDLTLTALANHLFVNASYFSWLFKQETGVTFTTYLTHVRMDTAKNLLKKDEQKVYEVAQFVGYNDYRHFCKMFKKVVGITPKDFKQRGK